MRVFSVRETAWIHAPLRDVWHRVTDLEKWPDWNRSMVEASWKGRNGFATGNRFRLVYPKRARPFLGGGRVEHVETERALGWSGGYLTLRVEFDLGFAATPQPAPQRSATPAPSDTHRKSRAGTEVDFSSQFSGFGARFVPTDSFVRWLTLFQREYLVSLRQACESVTGERWSEV